MIGQASELHLFVLWEKARSVESRVLEDLGRQAEIEVLRKWEFSFSGPAAEAYQAFYGGKKPMDGRLKVRKCGGGAFLLIVVRNLNPSYGSRWARDDKYYLANELMYDLKVRYREWAGRKHRVHGKAFGFGKLHVSYPLQYPRERRTASARAVY